MVFQKPNPFPKSIFDNVAYGPRVNGESNKKRLEEIVEKSLRDAALWDEVKDRLDSSGLGLWVVNSSVYVSPERSRWNRMWC